MADVKYVITVDESGATKKIETLDQALGELGKTSGQKAAPALGALWKQFAIGSIAADAARKGLRFFKDELLGTIKEAMEAERVDRALESALEITGRAARGVAASFRDYANALQRQTVYDDEAIKSAQTLLIQMTKLDRDGINRATRGAIGLASVLGMDLQSAAQLVAKAMEGNYAALSRYGIKVDESLSAGEKQAQLLERLASFYKRSQDEVDTLEGKTKQLNNAWNDFKQSVGEAVTKTGILQEAIKNLTASIKALGGEAEAIPEKLSFWEKIAAGVQGVIGPMVTAAATTKKWSDETYVLAEAWRQMSNMALAGRKAAIDPIPTVIRVVTTTQKSVAAALPPMREWVQLWTKFGMITKTLGETPLPGAKELPEAQLQWLGFQQTVSDTSDVWQTALESMTAGIISFGTATGSVFENMGAIFGNFIRSAISGLESLWIRQLLVSKGIVKAKQGEATASHIANIFKSVPFPFDLILAAGAFSVVNALFSKLLKFEKGGFFSKPTIAEVGHGNEYVLPERKLTTLIQTAMMTRPAAALVPAGAAAGLAGGSWNVTFGPGSIVINAPSLDDRTISQAGGRIFREVENQARLRGRRF